MRSPFLCVVWLAAFLFVGVLPGWADEGDASALPLVLVGSPLIEGAVHDLAGESLAVECFSTRDGGSARLPLDTSKLRLGARAQLIVRHESQAQVETLLGELGKGRSTRYLVVELCSPTPAAYGEFCTKLCKRLSQDFPGLSSTFQYNLTRLQNRLQTLEVDLRFRVQGLEGDAVVCQESVKPLVAWLELKPLASFPSQYEEPDEDRIKELVDLYVEEQPVAVAVNGPEAERLAKALARALKLRAVVLSPMPASGKAGAMERWIRDSVEHLVGAIDVAP